MRYDGNDLHERLILLVTGRGKCRQDFLYQGRALTA